MSLFLMWLLALSPCEQAIHAVEIQTSALASRWFVAGLLTGPVGILIAAAGSGQPPSDTLDPRCYLQALRKVRMKYATYGCLTTGAVVLGLGTAACASAPSSDCTVSSGCSDGKTSGCDTGGSSGCDSGGSSGCSGGGGGGSSGCS